MMSTDAAVVRPSTMARAMPTSGVGTAENDKSAAAISGTAPR